MLRQIFLTVFFGVVSSGLCAQTGAPEKPLIVRAIYPTGSEVSTTDQITIEFNQNIVALGTSMFIDDVVPIEIEPQLDCEWNWVKLNTLKCELPVKTELEPSTTYQVTVLPGIQSPRGRTMEQEYVHVFSTLTPTIRYTSLVSWLSPTEPIFEVRFNQSVQLASLLPRLLLRDHVSESDVTTTIVPYSRDLRNELRDDYFGRFRRFPTVRSLSLNESKRTARAVLISPRVELSPGAEISIVLSPGVFGAVGDVSSSGRIVIKREETTYEEFRFLGLICQDVFGNVQFWKVDQPEIPVCNVDSILALSFSSRFKEKEIHDLIHVQPTVDLRHRSLHGLRRLGTEEIEGEHYAIEGAFKPNTTYHLLISSEPPQVTPRGLQISTQAVEDGFGRPLAGPNQITFRTSRAAPEMSLEAAVLVTDVKKAFDPQLRLRNVEDVVVTYDLFDEQGIRKDQTLSKTSPDQHDVNESQGLGLRSALGISSGVMRGKIVSRPRFYRPTEQLEEKFFAQVTPLSVFFKLGLDRSLVWVTDIETGEPVANADVNFYKSTATEFYKSESPIANGRTDAAGLLALPGYATFNPHWERFEHSIRLDCEDGTECASYFLHVRTNEGFAILPAVDQFRMTGDYRSAWEEDVDHWATTPQKLYQPGDVVEIKGFVRREYDEQRVIPKDGNFALCIDGPEGRTYEIETLKLNEFGAYHTTLKLKERTPFGDYDVVLIHHPERPLDAVCAHTSYSARATLDNSVRVVFGGHFEVFEFKTNPIRVDQELNAKSYERGEPLTVITTAELHAGGAYAHAKGRVVLHLDSKKPPFTIVDTNDFEFSGNFYYLWEPLVEDEFELDLQGENVYTMAKLDSEVYYGDLIIETSVASARGKHVAARSSVPYYGVDQFVGIRRPDTFNIYSSGRNQKIAVGEPWPIEVLVLSKSEEIIAGKNVGITVYTRGKRYSNGLYDWHQYYECEVISAEQLAACEFTPEEVNHYRIQAVILDSKDREHRSSIEFEAIIDEYGSLKKVEPQEEIVKLELSCGSLEVAVGDSVQCNVENHFDSSPVLVTVERSGVLNHWIVKPDTAGIMVEFDVLESYSPHFRLSVLSTAPRDAIEGHVGNYYQGNFYQTATTKFTLVDPRSVPLSINVSTNSESYKPRDTVKLSVSTENNYGTKIPVEYAIAVVDEALLDLSQASDEYYDPTAKEWDIEEFEVRTYGLIVRLMNTSKLSAQNQSGGSSYSGDFGGSFLRVGPFEDPHLNKKTADPLTRQIDKLIAYWNPSFIPKKEKGELKFQLPDNLTKWKVLVMAVSTDDRFGFASTSFTSVKDTEIRAVAPNVVTEGDKFHVGASIYNRSDRKRTLSVELEVDGLVSRDTENNVYRTRLAFDPQERKVVSIPIVAGTIPVNFQNMNSTGEIRLVARVRGRGGDALDIRIPVRSSRVPVSSIVYGALEGDMTSIPVRVPEKLVDQTGELKLALTTNDSVNFDGVFRYIRDYRYPCWEQRLTRAVLAMQYLQLESKGEKHGLTWPNAEATIVQVLESVTDYQAPNGGMSYFAPRNSTVSPYLSAYTAIAFSWLSAVGYDVPQQAKQDLLSFLRDYLTWETGDLEYDVPNEERKLLGRFQATIGAVVLHALAISNELTETELVAFSEHFTEMDLFGLSQYLLAALKVDPSHPVNEQIYTRIMNHRNLVDGTVEFVEYAPLVCNLILHSETRSLCSILESLTLFSELSAQNFPIDELQELANSVRYSRDKLPRWMSTQDNVFCTNAMIIYSDYIGASVDELVANVDLHNQDSGQSTRLADQWEFNSVTTSLQSQYSLRPDMVGSQGVLDISRQGDGIAFYKVELTYLSEANENLNRYSGFEIHREYVVYRDQQPHILEPGDHVLQGEVVLVNLYLKNKFNRYFVVVDDTVPGGIEPVNFELGTESRFDASRELDDVLPSSQWYDEYHDARSSRWYFSYRELGLQSVRFFDKRLSRGKYHLQWVGQVITTGEFTAIPTHVEEMYRPVMFGKSEPWILIAKPE